MSHPFVAKSVMFPYVSIAGQKKTSHASNYTTHNNPTHLTTNPFPRLLLFTYVQAYRYKIQLHYIYYYNQLYSLVVMLNDSTHMKIYVNRQDTT